MQVLARPKETLGSLPKLAVSSPVYLAGTEQHAQVESSLGGEAGEEAVDSVSAEEAPPSRLQRRKARGDRGKASSVTKIARGCVPKEAEWNEARPEGILGLLWEL